MLRRLALFFYDWRTRIRNKKRTKECAEMRKRNYYDNALKTVR